MEAAGLRADEVTERILAGVRALITYAANGRLDPRKARAAFVRLFSALHLVELARSAPAMLQLLDGSIQEELDAFRKAGAGVEPIQAIERVARELEKRAAAGEVPNGA